MKDIDYLIENRASGAKSRQVSRYVLIPLKFSMIQDIDYLIDNRKPGPQ